MKRPASVRRLNSGKQGTNNDYQLDDCHGNDPGTECQNLGVRCKSWILVRNIYDSWCNPRLQNHYMHQCLSSIILLIRHEPCLLQQEFYIIHCNDSGKPSWTFSTATNFQQNISYKLSPLCSGHYRGIAWSLDPSIHRRESQQSDNTESLADKVSDQQEQIKRWSLLNQWQWDFW